MVHNTTTTPKSRDNIVGGVILIAVGILALVGQFVNLGDWGIYFVAGLGGLFLLLGILRRDIGWLIPGGILGGLGTGIVLVAGPWQTALTEDQQGGVFLLAFAAGWLLITALSAVFTRETAWWALIPAGILALIGATVLFGGAFETVLRWLGQGWPVVLILIGLYVMVRSDRFPRSR